MVTRQHSLAIRIATLTCSLAALAPTSASAQLAVPPEPAATPAPTAETPTPRVHHGAIASAPPGEKLAVEATFEHPELIRNAVLVYQTTLNEVRAVPFQRSGEQGYLAVIPAEALRAPGIGYTIEVEQTNGKRFSAFATRADMHRVSVIEERMDAAERASLARLGGRRSVLTAGGEYVGFGTTRASTPIPCGPNQPDCNEGDLIVPEQDESYYRAEVGYTYRPLRLVSEFGFRLGIVRGQSLVRLDVYDAERYKVGLNFGAARIRFRIFENWHAEAELLTSITEIGFSVGLGASTLIGDPYGSKIILGFETLGLGDSAPFGTRFYSRIDMVAGERLLVSPIVEVTDMPNADSFGVRLLGELSINLVRGFSLQLRGGYQARRSTSGGPGFGGNVTFAF